MNQTRDNRITASAGWLSLGVLVIFFTAPVFGEVEISLDDQPTPTSVPSPIHPPAAAPTAVPETVSASPVPTPGPVIEEPTPTVMEVHGLFKAKEAYEAGMKAYGEMDYDRAIKYLKLALDRHDAYTKSYILAEANAMLGVIYQFHIIHLGTAYAYYKDALAVDPDTETAKKHIREVYKYRNRKD